MLNGREPRCAESLPIVPVNQSHPAWDDQNQAVRGSWLTGQMGGRLCSRRPSDDDDGEAPRSSFEACSETSVTWESRKHRRRDLASNAPLGQKVSSMARVLPWAKGAAVGASLCFCPCLSGKGEGRANIVETTR